MSAERRCEVVVVGGGPAGAAAAATLARAGRDVVLLERQRFPRYHVGESLLPYCWWTLDRIGARAAVEAAGFQEKFGVRFVSADGRMSRPFDFSEHLDHPAARTWQVDRATFDRLLLDNARTQGAQVVEDAVATGLVEVGHGVRGVTATTPEGPLTVHAGAVIDATGRDGFVRGLRRWKRPEPLLDRFAVWTYYDGVPREEGLHAGATTVVQLPDDGWFWVIPMAGKTSVGVVARREVLFAETRDPESALRAQMGRNPWLAARVAGATALEPVQVTSDYSYRSAWCADDGVVLAGDAFAFLDPVFSSGVFLALRSGEEAARAVHAALTRGDVSGASFAEYGAWLCRGMEAMRALVFSFYDPQFSMGRLVAAHPELRGDVTDLLIGNLFRGYDDLFRALTELSEVPAPLDYGGARTSEVA